jgi:cytochrome c oxidase subunit 2
MVPGMRTTLKFKPIYTTKEMKEITGNPDFEYILMCNKICGASHSQMNMPVYVGTEDEFNAWRDAEGNVTRVSSNPVEETEDEGEIINDDQDSTGTEEIVVDPS